MDDIIVTLIVAVLSSGALSALINGYFESRRDKRSKATGLESKVDALAASQKELRDAVRTQEKDSLRVELKLMISDYPHETSDILRLAEYYFCKLHGNWTMANIFVKWCKDNKIEIPQWYKGEEHNEQ